MGNNEQYEGQAEIEAMERQMDVEEGMYFKGMEIAEKMGKINQNNPFEWTRFVENLSDHEIKCLEFYEKQQKTSHGPSTTYEKPNIDENIAYLMRGVKPTTDKLSDLVVK